MGAQSRLFTSLASGSGKATAVVACAVMLLAGCGGSGGSASDASTPVIRGDAPAASAPTVAVPGAPAAPTGAAGDGKVTVTVAAGSSGGTPTSYTVTAVSTTKTCTVIGATGGSCDVAGLMNGTPYTFTATATNQGGTSGVSIASNAVTPVAAATTATVRTVTFVLMGTGVWQDYRQSASTPTALMSNTFVNPGSSFLGWNTKNDGSGVWYADGEVFPFTSDTELISIWGKPGQPYKIIAKLEGPATGSVSFLAAPNTDGTPAASMNYVLGVGRSGGRTFAERTVSGPGTYLFDLPPDPTYYFYVQFAGRSLSSTPASLEVPAVVTFNANGGTGTMANQTSSKQALLTANAFTRPGYVFDGWSLSPTGGLRFGDGTGYEFLASITVYARWVPATQFTVTFNANGGTGTMASQSANLATPLTANAYTRQGYVFDGWATSSGGSSAYADRASYPFTANATLYARWLQIPTVTFNANGGSGTMENQSTNVATALTANAFTRSGYVFDGWATTPTGIMAYAAGASYPFTSTATLYARWVPTFTVTFNANGGSGTMPNQTAGGSTALTANAFTRKAYAFDGWATTGTGQSAYADGGKYPFTANATLYARWVCKPFAVTVTGAYGLGTTKASVNFKTTSELPMTTVTARTTTGGYSATITTSALSGVIYVTGIVKDTAYKFKVTGTNTAGCSSTNPGEAPLRQ